MTWGGGRVCAAIEDNGDGGEVNLAFANPTADNLGEVKFHKRPAPWLLERHVG